MASSTYKLIGLALLTLTLLTFNINHRTNAAEIVGTFNLTTAPDYHFPLSTEEFLPALVGVEDITDGDNLVINGSDINLETLNCIQGSCIHINNNTAITYELEDYDRSIYSSLGTTPNIAFYFKFDDLPSVNTGLAGYHLGTTSQRSWYVYYDVSDSDLDIVVSTTGSNTITVDGPGTILIDTWYLIIIEKSNSPNGVSVRLIGEDGSDASALNNNFPFASGSPTTFWLASANAAGSNDYSMYIDELMIWENHALTSGEKTELINLLNTETNPTPKISDYGSVSATGVTNDSLSADVGKLFGYNVNFQELEDLNLITFPGLLDFYVVDDTFTELPYLILAGSSINSATSVFTELDVLSTETRTINSLATLGASELSAVDRIDTSWFSDGDDVITFADVASLDLTDDFTASVSLTLDASPASEAYIFTKYTASTGYSLGYISTDAIRIRIDGQTCDSPASTLTYPFTGSIGINVDTAYLPGQTQVSILKDGDIVETCVLATGSITANSQDLEIATDDFDGKINRIVINNTAGDSIVDLKFEPGIFTETQKGSDLTSWIWLGTLTNGSDAGPTEANYTIISDLSDYTIDSVGLLLTSGPEDIITIPTATPVNIIGTPPSAITTPNPSLNVPFTPIIIDSADAIGITDQALWFIFIYAVAVMVGFGIHSLLNTEFLAVLLMSVIVLTGTLSGIYAAWLSASTIPIILGVYALAQLRRIGQT